MYLRSPVADWRQQAACRGLDTAIFFPESRKRSDQEAAQRVCRSCPVRRNCLSNALRDGEKRGIWGGTTENDRRQMASVGQGSETFLGDPRSPVSPSA
ncbi:MAG: WhiB family transcriptional regulator [Acidimicrobiales bacterium]|nr:WhiB family transcriptional regulator [Acidimicrobiales bacterium]